MAAAAYTAGWWVGMIAAGAALLAVLSIVWHSWRNGISPMPASSPVRRAVAAELLRLGPRGSAVEAGSGWGSLALHTARRCPGWRLIGIENSPLPLAVSRLLARRRPEMRFMRGDLFAYPYEDADAVICYLYPGAMNRLAPLLRRHLAPGACVISVCFALPGWTPVRTVVCADLYRTPVYVYVR